MIRFIIWFGSDAQNCVSLPSTTTLRRAHTHTHTHTRAHEHKFADSLIRYLTMFKLKRFVL